MDLTDASVLVTGASSGIGRETAILLSRLNARVVLVGRNEARLQETLHSLDGAGHVISAFDLSATNEIAGWMKTLVSETGPLKALVHAAGKQLTMPMRMLSGPAFDDLIRTNLTSAAMLTRGFCQKSCRTANASVVYVSSVMGLVGKPGIAAYSASKAALIGMTRSLAVELAPEVRVNCVAPAFVESEMLDQVRAALPPEQFEAMERAHPLGFGKPRDVANAIAFLISDTGRWITGTTLTVDGGYSAQ
jgi:NAD(P)-dependent dehydrogenase (short-subunit alcohol dehydrogenase family)